ncbi:MAG: GAF domain-containing protein [Myxococcota bacterium]
MRADVQEWLKTWMRKEDGAVSATVHTVRADGNLYLDAHINLTPELQETLAVVSPGEGMIGKAFAQRRILQTQDVPDDIRVVDLRFLLEDPDIAEYDPCAAVAIPVPLRGPVRAVLGMAFDYGGDYFVELPVLEFELVSVPRGFDSAPEKTARRHEG